MHKNQLPSYGESLASKFPEIAKEWCYEKNGNLIPETTFAGSHINPAKRNVLDLKNETCKNREKRNVLKISHTRHFKTTKKQSKTGCFYSF